MKQYEYKFVRIKLSMWFSILKIDYKKAILEHAEEGWKLVQIFTDPGTYASFIELIFEREK